MDIYSVYMAGEKVGTAEVTKQGLYYRIRCLCAVCDSVPLRIHIMAEKDADLGLCVPMGSGFGLECSVPIKRIGMGHLRFYAKPKYAKEEQITEVSCDEPFAYIGKLKDAYLIRRNGVTGIGFRVTDRSQDQPGSDQSP